MTRGLVISGAPSTAGTLYPGGNADVVLTVKNPNDRPVRIASFVARGAITSDSEALCPGDVNLRFATPAAGVGSIEARATERIVLRGAVSMSPDAPQGCADRIFTIPLAFGNRSSS